MKLPSLTGLAFLVTLIGAQDPPERNSEDILFDLGNIDRLEVTLSYNLGSLTVRSNPDTDGIAGKIEYLPGLVRPKIEYDVVGSRGKLDIQVGYDADVDMDQWLSFPGQHDRWWKHKEGHKYQSDLEIRLPPGTPIDIDLELGFGEADLDLSHLTISNLHLECGLSDVEISMDTPNAVQSRRLTVETGLGDFKATGLGNLKAKTITIEVGLGSADLDLLGDVVEDVSGRIEVGLSSLNLVLPRNTNIRLEIRKSFLSSVDVDDLYQEGEDWVSDRWDPDLPTVELEVNVGLGSVDVDVR